jgi:hypothetical protein
VSEFILAKTVRCIAPYLLGCVQLYFFPDVSERPAENALQRFIAYYNEECFKSVLLKFLVLGCADNADRH